MYALVITQFPQDICLSSTTTETRHLSCGIRMSTNAEPDMDSVDWSNGSVKEWLSHIEDLLLPKRPNQKDRPSEGILLRETSVPVSLFGRSQVVRKGYSSSQSIASFEVMTQNTFSYRLECLLMRTYWRPRSIKRLHYSCAIIYVYSKGILNMGEC